MTKFTKGRNICFTLFDDEYKYTNFINIFNNDTDAVIKYLIIGFEWSKEGKFHFQGYVQLNKEMRRKAFNRFFMNNTYHLEKQSKDSTNTQARNYCWKGAFETKGTKYPQPSCIFLDFGEFCPGSGYRKDLHKIKKLIESGKSRYDIIKEDDNFNTYSLCHSFFDKYMSDFNYNKYNCIRDNVDVYILYGECATGKTESVLRYFGCKDVYKLRNSQGDNKSWNGYSNQKVLLIDDFYSWIKLDLLLQILDNKPFRLRKLHGYSMAQWHTVVITSNLNPGKWYPNIFSYGENKELKDALFSRVKKCLKVSRGNTNEICYLETLSNFVSLETSRNNFDNYVCFKDVTDFK